MLAPTVAPAVSNVTALNSTAVVVDWFPINGSNEDIIGYVIEWDRLGHKQNGTDNISDVSTTSHVLTGLRKYSNYSVRIAAYNRIGIGKFSNMLLVHTEPDGKKL